MSYILSVESRQCHPETCCCDSHGIYVIREKNYSFVSRHETQKEAEEFIELLNRRIGQ